jgi:hypothetical protein
MEFHKVLAQTRNRVSDRQSSTDSGLCRRKVATMAWCLFEALRDNERRFLAEACCMAVS